MRDDFIVSNQLTGKENSIAEKGSAASAIEGIGPEIKALLQEILTKLNAVDLAR